MKRYIWNLLVAIDQLANTACGGDPDETISSRVGKWAKDSSYNSGAKKPAYKLVRWVTELFEKDHLAKAIEEDEGKNELLK